MGVVSQLCKFKHPANFSYMKITFVFFSFLLYPTFSFSSGFGNTTIEAGNYSQRTRDKLKKEFTLTPAAPKLNRTSSSLELPYGPVKILRVLKVTDSRCPDINQNELFQIFLNVRKILLEQFKIGTTFEIKANISIGNFFKNEKMELMKYFLAMSMIRNVNNNTYKPLNDKTLEMIKQGGWKEMLGISEFDIWKDDPGIIQYRILKADEKDILKYFPKNLKQEKVKNDVLRKKLCNHFREHLTQLKKIQGLDDKPLLDKNYPGYFSSVRWRMLLHNTTSYDVVVTNTLILETAKRTDLHVFARGGIINGFVASINPDVSLTTVFPVLSEDSCFENKDRMNLEERDHAIAYILAHELGHQLFNLPDDYTGKIPLMNPPGGFHYKRWYKGIEKSTRAYHVTLVQSKIKKFRDKQSGK